MAIETTCCIVGGGPAGMMLGLLLARAGIDVQILEKHADFLRDFRGDTIHSSTLDVLDDIGIADRFLALPHSEIRQFAIPVANDPPRLDLEILKVKYPFIALVPQWDFLELLASEGRRYPGFHLQMETEALDLLVNGDRVQGLRCRTSRGEEEIQARLTVAADGRHSVIRDKAGLQLQSTSPPMDVLWFRLRHEPSDPEGVFGRIASHQLAVFLNRRDYWQVGYIIPKGSAEELKVGGIENFKEQLAGLMPDFTDRISELREWEEIKLLSVRSDCLRRWWKSGLLLIGDAAHAMSPIGGVGINLAIQDAVAAYNILGARLGQGEIADTELARVQRRRELPTYLTQKFQEILQRRVLRKVLDGQNLKAPLLLRMMLQIPFLRQLIAHIFARGFRPERVRWHPQSEARRHEEH